MNDNGFPGSPTAVATDRLGFSGDLSGRIHEARRGVLGASVVVSGLSAAGFLANFALQIVLAASFGATVQMDAYLAATTVPTLVTAVLLSSLNTILVPVFIQYEHRDQAEAWRVANTVINLVVIVLAAMAGIGAVTAPIITWLTVPGFGNGTFAFDMTTNLTRLLFPSVVFSGFAALLTSVYSAQHRFVVPALAPVINSVVVLACVWTSSSSLGIYSVAWGTLFGAVAQACWLVPILRHRPYQFAIDAKHPAVRQVAELLWPLLLGACFYRANSLVDRLIASSLPEGSISYLGYAWRMTNIVVAVATGGISATLFPFMSRQVAAHDVDGLRTTISSALRGVVLLVAPVLTITPQLALPALTVLLQRGSFTPEATRATGLTLVCYLGAVLGMSLGNVVTFALYALQRTRSVATVGVCGALLNTLLALILSRYLSYLGPALAFSITALVNVAVMFVVLQNRIGKLEAGQIVATAAKAGAASAAVAVCLALSKTAILPRSVGGHGEAIAVLAFGALTVPMYLVILAVLKTQELRLVGSAVASRWRHG